MLFLEKFFFPKIQKVRSILSSGGIRPSKKKSDLSHIKFPYMPKKSIKTVFKKTKPSHLVLSLIVANVKKPKHSIVTTQILQLGNMRKAISSSHKLLTSACSGGF